MIGGAWLRAPPLEPPLLVKHNKFHSKETPYKCHMCDKAFGVSGSLNDHMRLHTVDKPYKCSLCNNKVSANQATCRHINAVFQQHKTT